MRKVLLFLLALTSVSAHELIYISEDASRQSLERLQQTYRQTLLIQGNKVYLIPSDCRLERYFGGAAQAAVRLSSEAQRTQELIITQEIFEAKDANVLQEKIEAEKSISLVQGKVPKAFLDDKEGRGYGGASQTPLDLSFQKTAATQVHIKTEVQDSSALSDKEPHRHPSCQLLDDGSGYRLHDTQDAYLYSDRNLHPISDTTIFFN